MVCKGHRVIPSCPLRTSKFEQGASPLRDQEERTVSMDFDARSSFGQ